MVRLGYVTGNRMTNVQTRNVKLQARALRILMAEAGLDEDAASKALLPPAEKLPVALVDGQTGCDLSQASAALLDSGGIVSEAVNALENPFGSNGIRKERRASKHVQRTLIAAPKAQM